MNAHSKHTPGPWHIGAMNDALFIINRPPSPAGTDLPPDTPHPGLLVIAKMGTANGSSNARLIAAAPELLEALIEVRDHLYTKQDMDRCREKARAAIAKAEGAK